MIVTVNRDSLAKALSVVKLSVAGRSTLPVLSAVKVTADASTSALVLTSTDLDTTTVYHLTAAVEQDGTALPSFDMLDSFVKELPKGAGVTLSAPLAPATAGASGKSSLRVSCGRYKLDLQCHAEDDFPSRGEGDGDSDAVSVTIAADAFRRVVRRVAFAAAGDDTRPALAGVLVEYQTPEGGLVLAAADGYRLSVDTVPVTLADAVRSLVPAPGLAEIAKVLAGDNVTLTFRKNTLSVSDDSTTFTSRVIDGQFPNYRQIVPTSHKGSWTVSVKDLTAAVRSVRPVATEDRLRIDLATLDGAIRVSAKAADYGEAAVEVVAQTEGEPLAVALNVGFLADALAVVEGENVLVELQSPLRPVVFHDGTLLHVLMPLTSNSR
jgi:DNA polymerase III subunit beta